MSNDVTEICMVHVYGTFSVLPHCSALLPHKALAVRCVYRSVFNFTVRIQRERGGSVHAFTFVFALLSCSLVTCWERPVCAAMFHNYLVLPSKHNVNSKHSNANMTGTKHPLVMIDTSTQVHMHMCKCKQSLHKPKWVWVAVTAGYSCAYVVLFAIGQHSGGFSFFLFCLFYSYKLSFRLILCSPRQHWFDQMQLKY